MVSRNEKARFESLRAIMVKDHLMGRDITDEKVLEVMGRVEREEFVPSQYADQAYNDCPLPIGMGQTISQPYIVALMTEWLEVKPDSEVLEIGTGCGYQTAVLAALGQKVYTIEVLGQLQENAMANLARNGVENVEFYIGDGSVGWPEEREFDRIIVTAAAPEIPNSLKEQLKDGGKMVIPVGGEFFQELIVVERNGNDYIIEKVCGCRFVKLIGKEGF